MTHILEDSTHEIEGQTSKKEVDRWALGTCMFGILYILRKVTMVRC